MKPWPLLRRLLTNSPGTAARRWTHWIPVCIVCAFVGAWAGERLLKRLHRPAAPPALDHVPGQYATPDAFRYVGMEPGAPAPPLSVVGVDAPGQIDLAKFAGRPLVLVFGSFTCNVFCEQTAALERLFKEQRAAAEFLFVSVTEAGHEIQGLEFMLEDVPPGADTLPIWRARIAKAMRIKGVTLPSAIDVSRATTVAYGAYPLRFVIVGPDGKIALDLGRTLEPWDLRRAEAVLQTLATGKAG